jgi:transposase
MKPYSLDLRDKIVASVKKGVPKSETARRFGVDRATVKRYCKQLDERGTLQPRKAPGKRPKLDEKAKKLLLEDLEERPWATHSQRAEFLFALSGVRVSEATICRAVGRLQQEPKKRSTGAAERDEFLRAHWRIEVGGVERSWAAGVRRCEMGTHTSLTPLSSSSVRLRAQ